MKTIAAALTHVLFAMVLAQASACSAVPLSLAAKTESASAMFSR